MGHDLPPRLSGQSDVEEVIRFSADVAGTRDAAVVAAALHARHRVGL